MTMSESSQPAATTMTRVTRVATWILALSLMGGSVAGCLGAGIEANKRQLRRSRRTRAVQGEIAALRQPQAAYASAAAPAGACDMDVMRKATQRGGEAFAQSDFKQALGYYQDAQSACPGNAEAELNLARADEALGEREAAISNYTHAANAASGSDPAILKQARDALERLRAAK